MQRMTERQFVGLCVGIALLIVGLYALVVLNPSF